MNVILAVSGQYYSSFKHDKWQLQ